jgi:hypothetical protein
VLGRRHSGDRETRPVNRLERDRGIGPHRGASILLTLALIAIVAAVGGSDRARTAEPLPPGIQFGFNQWIDSSKFPLQRQLNAPIRRFPVGWNQVEATPGNWNWTSFDARYNSLVAAGLKPLIVAVGPPCWSHPSKPCSETSTSPPDPAYDADWAEFIRRLTSRYPLAVGIEIENEENYTKHFAPYPDPARYTQLLKEAYGVVKGVDPIMPVISGGLAPREISGSLGMAYVEFVQGMYDAGAKGYMDGIGIHPYPIAGGWDGTPQRFDPARSEQILGKVRAVRNAAGDGATPLWVTEFGVSTTDDPGLPPGVTEPEQASDLVTIVRSLKADNDVRVAVIHNLVDYVGVQSGFGVYRTDNSPKTAACALSVEFHGTLICDTGGVLPPPDTTIDSGPADGSTTADNSATVTYHATPQVQADHFECSLDGAAFNACPSSGQSYGGLSDGSHSFAVRAVGAAGGADQTPASRTWTVDTTAPDTAIDSGPTSGSSLAPSTTTATTAPFNLQAAIRRCKKKFAKGTTARKKCIRKARRRASL